MQNPVTQKFLHFFKKKKKKFKKKNLCLFNDLGASVTTFNVHLYGAYIDDSGGVDTNTPIVDHLSKLVREKILFYFSASEKALPLVRKSIEHACHCVCVVSACYNADDFGCLQGASQYYLNF
jgi:hypothetical protein